MILSSDEEPLIRDVRALPAEEAEKLANWKHQLADLAGGRPIEWSGEWRAEDLADAAAQSIRNFDLRETDQILRPGDVVQCAFPGAQVTKTRPAVVLCTRSVTVIAPSQS